MIFCKPFQSYGFIGNSSFNSRPGKNLSKSAPTPIKWKGMFQTYNDYTQTGRFQNRKPACVDQTLIIFNTYPNLFHCL